MSHIVKIMPSSLFDSKTKNIPIFMPEKDQDGNILFGSNGSVAKLKTLGGAKIGSVGQIAGDILKVSKVLVYGKNNLTPTVGEELVDLIPVMFFEYKQLGYVLAENVKITG